MTATAERLAVPDAPRRRGPRPRLDGPVAVALALGLAGVGYRLVLVLFVVPPGTSDEGLMGLAAMHVATGHDFPIFFYGQHYMGAVEAYLAAPLFAAFAPSTVLLRVPLLVGYAAFLYVMYRLTRRLFDPPWYATLVVGLLALGSYQVLIDQLRAVGGYPEVTLAGAVLMLLAVALGQRGVHRRLLAFAAFGLVAGCCAWIDWLVLPYLAGAGAVLVHGCRRELLGRAGLVLVGGFAVGVLPLVLDNLTAPPGQDTLSVLGALNGEGTGGWLDRWHGAVVVGVPQAGGLCSTAGCGWWTAWWGWGYPVLLLAAVALAAAGLVAGRRRVAVPRLALLGAAALTIVAYARTESPVITPLPSARYLSCLLISLPAVLWPLWAAARAAPRPVAVLPVAPLAGLVVVMLVATGQVIADSRSLSRRERQLADLARVLEARGLTRVYSEYWTCGRLTFVSRERVLCAVLGDDLRQGQNRFPAYWYAVQRAPGQVFVLPAGEPIDASFQWYVKAVKGSATMTEVDGYRIYRTRTPIALP